MNEGAQAAANAIDHLFRDEAGRISAAVVRLLGIANLDLAEDVVQDTLAHALEIWKFRGLPDNPAAWLMRAARNRALDVIRRQRTARRFAPAVADLLATEWSTVHTVTTAFLEKEIADAELALMVSLCDARLPVETQVMVVLKYLCGFGAHELAQVFLGKEDAIDKRLMRARATLAAAGAIGADGDRVDEVRLRARLPAVCQVLYMLFSEGYHGSYPEAGVRLDLCREALRLTNLLAGHAVTSVPEVHALLALMCLLAARLDARQGPEGDLVLLEDHDRGSWDRALVDRGLAALARSAAGDVVSATHVEAAIAAQHVAAPTWEAIDWPAIVPLYDRLWRLRPTAVVALDRAVAVSRAHGADAGLAALDEAAGARRVQDFLFLAAARADLLRQAGRCADAIPHYRRALELARSEPERRFFAGRLDECAANAPTRSA